MPKPYPKLLLCTFKPLLMLYKVFSCSEEGIKRCRRNQKKLSPWYLGTRAPAYWNKSLYFEITFRFCDRGLWSCSWPQRTQCLSAPADKEVQHLMHTVTNKNKFTHCETAKTILHPSALYIQMDKMTALGHMCKFRWWEGSSGAC